MFGKCNFHIFSFLRGAERKNIRESSFQCLTILAVTFEEKISIQQGQTLYRSKVIGKKGNRWIKRQTRGQNS